MLYHSAVLLSAAMCGGCVGELCAEENHAGSGGGGTHIYHWEEPRALTNRERARLQTFPDTYEFQGTKESVRKQIGMAVPCRGAQMIFEAILKSFAGIDYPSIEANIDE